MRLRGATPVVALTALLALTACGTTEAPADEESGATLTVTDARGVEVELDGPAQRVVTTEWNVTEYLVALGVEPVGAADIDGYNTWDTAAPISDDATDIGTRGEPSMDTVASLNPDLVVATTDLPETAIQQLEEFVPVLVVQSAELERPLDRLRENVELVAEATGTEDAAEDLLAQFDAALADGAAAIEEAGLAGTPLAFADGWVTGGQVTIRPFVSGSQLAAINEELGFTTPWEVEGDPAYGLGSTDVEGLTALGDTKLLYITSSAETDPFTSLAGNAVWESLPFVQSGDVHRLPDGIWMFGGPKAMIQYIDAVVAAVTA